MPHRHQSSSTDPRMSPPSEAGELKHPWDQKRHPSAPYPGSTPRSMSNPDVDPLPRQWATVHRSDDHKPSIATATPVLCDPYHQLDNAPRSRSDAGSLNNPSTSATTTGSFPASSHGGLGLRDALTTAPYPQSAGGLHKHEASSSVPYSKLNDHYHSSSGQVYIPPGPRSAPTPPTYMRDTMPPRRPSDSSSQRKGRGSNSNGSDGGLSHEPSRALPGTMSSRTMSSRTMPNTPITAGTTMTGLTMSTLSEQSSESPGPDSPCISAPLEQHLAPVIEATNYSTDYNNTPAHPNTTTTTNNESTFARSASTQLSSTPFDPAPTREQLRKEKSLQKSPMPSPTFGSFGKRWRSAFKDIFRREPVDRAALEKIEDRHWTDDPSSEEGSW